jgi:ElaB/YqjD/DUF883 family membrane-anchored ribosome-binding protein
MESRIDDAAAPARSFSPEKLVDDLKNVIARAEEKAVERAKAADRVIRDHPYPTIGLAFGVGLLIGFLVARK